MYKKFKLLIDEKGITTYRVAMDIGIPVSSLYDWKAGRYTPKIDKLSKIATYLGITIEELIKEED